MAVSDTPQYVLQDGKFKEIRRRKIQKQLFWAF